jgi:hypothetical protein
MAALFGPALVAATLLALAGAQKLLDPTMTVGALRALRLPSAPGLVRTGAGAELAIGVLAASAGGQVLWALVAGSYVAFSVFVLASLRAGSPVGTCGCFGREETPPHPVHLGLNIALAVAAATAALTGRTAADHLPSTLLGRLSIGALLVLSLVLTYATYVAVPRLFAAMRSVRELDLSSLGRAHHALGR